MSHFVVLVIGDDVEAALAPFQENNGGNCPAEYLQFVDRTDEVMREWEDADDAERAEFGDPEKFAHEVHGYREVRESEGKRRIGYLENPNRKWDWYQIGGRWSGLLPLRNGERVNTAQKREIDWSIAGADAVTKARLDFAKWQAALDANPEAPRPRSWDEIRVAHTESTEGSRASNLESARLEYATQPAVASWIKLVDMWTPRRVEPVGDYGFDVEAYAEKMRRDAAAPFAYLHEGQWHERGKMLFFGLVADETKPLEWCDKWEAFWESLPDDARVTVVDCHI